MTEQPNNNKTCLLAKYLNFSKEETAPREPLLGLESQSKGSNAQLVRPPPWGSSWPPASATVFLPVGPAMQPAVRPAPPCLPPWAWG